MADVKKWKEAVLSSGNPNRYKYMVLVLGIKLASFLKNPIMLYVHKRADGTIVKFPIGRWEDIRIESGQLVARPVFDLKDEMGKEVARRWEEGFLHATSIRHTFDKVTDDPTQLKAGADYAVTECEILEASIVDIPGDADAVVRTAVLSFEVSETLVLHNENTPLSTEPLLDKKTIVKSENQNQNLMDNKTLCLSLGLAENATSEQISAAIAKLTNAPKVEAALSLGRTKGIVNADNEAAMRTMVEANPDAFQLAWTAVPTPVAPAPTGTLAAAVQPQGVASALRQLSAENNPKPTAVADDRKNWTLKDWRMKDADGLLALEKTDPTEFERIVKTGVGLGLAVVGSALKTV